MKKISHFLVIIVVALFISNQRVTAQCFQIESILVDACSPNNPTNDEGFNEMVRFKVGSTPINLATTPLTVTWPNTSNLWLGLIQDATTAAKVATLNANIVNAGACGQILEPTGGVLPANATVILVTSQNLNTAYNSFASLTGTIYMIFQNNLTQFGGNFANYNVTPGTRTLTMSFGSSCTDSVTYERSLLVNIYGTYGGTTAENDGATVNFTPSGGATYVNYGCNAPIPPFNVNAGTAITACKGSTINLVGTAVGQDGLLWSAPSGTFSNPTSLTTSYTIDPNATGSSVTLTLTGTKSNGSCTQTKTSTVVITFTLVALPTVTSPINYCQNVNATPLNATATGGGILNWYNPSNILVSSAPTPSTSSIGSTTYYVSQTISGCESTKVPITVTVANTGPSLGLSCDLTNPNTTANAMTFAFSNVGQTSYSYSYSIAGGTAVTGNWVSPQTLTIGGMTPGQSITLTLNANGVSCIAPMTVTCNTPCTSMTTPSFNAIGPICLGATAPNLPTTSTNGISGTWSPNSIDTSISGVHSYTFTPDSVLFPCATTTSLSVTVTNPTLPSFASFGPYCQNSTASNLPITSNNGINGSWIPAVISTATSGTQTYTFTPSLGQCATTTSLNVTINTTIIPSFSAIGPFCQNSIPSTLPTNSTNSISGIWSPTTINTSNVGSQIYTFIPNAGQCATTVPINVNINPNVVPIFSSMGPYCQNSIANSLPNTSINSIIGTWSPATIATTLPGTQIYTFTPNSGQCATPASLNISITAPTIPVFSITSNYCQNATPDLLPNTSSNGVSGTWSPAIINTAIIGSQNYIFTPNSGICANSFTLTVVITTPTIPNFSLTTSYCQNAIPDLLPPSSSNGIIGIWTPATISTASVGTQNYVFTPNANQCALSKTLTVNTQSIVTPTFSNFGPYCQNSTPPSLPSISTNGIIGTWTPATVSTSVVGLQSYLFTPNVGQCGVSNTIQIGTIEAPIINTPTNYEVCDDNNDGISCLFLLNTKDS
ncbi:hypothetical protein CLV55_110114, partial [Flavobacterium aciduliphilum]